jgi:hypothetical protein
MDARVVQRLLEKIQGMAETAETVGMRTIEGMQREPHLSDTAKQTLTPLFREHALRLMWSYSQLGATVCETIRSEAEDNTARGLIDLFHANFAAMASRSQDMLKHEFGTNDNGG